MAAARRLASIIPEVSHRIFTERPGTYLSDLFLDHIRRTGQPETFNGLYWQRLDKTERFDELARFEIRRGIRPSDVSPKAPCPMCGRDDWYWRGSLIYIPRLQAVAAIGHECADHDVAAAAKRERRDRERSQNDENYLFDCVPLIAEQLRILGSLHPAAAETLRVFRQFRKDAPKLHRRLRNLNDGRLVVHEQIAAENGVAGLRSPRGEQYREISFGRVEGPTALLTDYNPVKQLDRIVAAIAKYECVGTSDDAILNHVVALVDKGYATPAAIELRWAANEFRRIAERLDDFGRFFTANNIGMIAAWGSHPLQPKPFVIRLRDTPSGEVFSVQGEDYERCQITIGSAMRNAKFLWPEPEKK